MSFDELRDALHLRLGRLTEVIAQLDLNIGLAVNWLGQNNGLDVSNLIDPAKARFNLRLAMLKKLVDITTDQRSPQKTTEFAHWFERASNLPAIKNNYIHAIWRFHGIADGEEPYVLFKVPGWNHLPDPPDNGAKLTLMAFEQQIGALKQLNKDFVTMCDRRAEYTAPFLAAFASHRLASRDLYSEAPSTALQLMSQSMPLHTRPATTAGMSALN